MEQDARAQRGGVAGSGSHRTSAPGPLPSHLYLTCPVSAHRRWLLNALARLEASKERFAGEQTEWRWVQESRTGEVGLPLDASPLASALSL